MNIKTMTKKSIGLGFFSTRIVFYLTLLLIMVFIMSPLIWMILGSFKGKIEFYVSALSLPKQFLWQNYVRAWNEAQIGMGLFNSLIVTIGTLVPTLMFGSLAAYSFSRFKFLGNRLLFLMILSGLMITPEVLVLPVSTILADMNLLNTHFGLILIYIAWNLPFSVFLLRAFFTNIPQEILDAGQIDGCSNLKIFWSIVLPLIRPGFFTVAIFCGVRIWNEFLFALIFLRDDALKTFPVAIMRLKGQYASEYVLILAGLTIAVLPLFVLFLAFNRQFIKGLTSGSLKM